MAEVPCAIVGPASARHGTRVLPKSVPQHRANTRSQKADIRCAVSRNRFCGNYKRLRLAVRIDRIDRALGLFKSDVMVVALTAPMAS